MAYIPNPDVQPGKKGGKNVQAIEDQATGHGQFMYGTGKVLDAYGDGSSSNVGFGSAPEGFIGSEGATKLDLNRRAGVSGSQDSVEAGYPKPAEQEVRNLYAYTDPNNADDLDVSSLYEIDTTGSLVGSRLKQFVPADGFIEEDITIAKNTTDDKMYRLAAVFNTEEESQPVLIFDKTDLSSFTTTPITLSGYLADPGTFQGTSSVIEDGGNDMFDEGNMLSTDLTPEGEVIEYVHTKHDQNAYGDDFVLNLDGAITDGTTNFGTGSSYVTNLYPAMFVLIARGITIDAFKTTGNNGADGGGNQSTHDFTITVNSHTYSVFTKSIGDATDPSINHIMIVPKPSGITHTFGSNTDDDFDQIAGLTGASDIYYLLLSQKSGVRIDNTALENIASAFMGLMGNETLADDLASLNANYANVTSLLTNAYAFTDAGSVGEFINVIAGINEPRSIAYVGGGNFACCSGTGFYKITSSGVISLIDADLNYIYSLVYFNNTLYGISQAEGLAIVSINPTTGELGAFVELNLEGLLNVVSTTVVGNDITALVETINESEEESFHLATIDPATGDVTLVSSVANVFDQISGM